MGKRKAPSRTCPECDARVHNKKPRCDCGHVFEKPAKQVAGESAADKRRAAAAAVAAEERRAAAVAATEQAPRFLRDSSKSPVASTKPSLLTVLRLEPNIHPGTKKGFPEYVATRVISCLTCPDTDAERVCEPPYVDYYARHVAQCELERRPLPPLPRPKYVIRKARGGLHSELQLSLIHI